MLSRFLQVSKTGVGSLSSARGYGPRSLSCLRFFANDDQSIVVPSMGDSISEGTIVSWLKKVDQGVQQDEVIVQIETDKIVVDVHSPESGVLSAILAKENETVRVGQELAKLRVGAAPASPAPEKSVTESKASPATPPPPPSASAPTPAPSPASAAAVSPPPPASAPQVASGDAPERRVPMTRMRRRIAERLKEAQNTCAMLTTFNEIDMTNIMQLRSDLKDAFQKKHDAKLGFMSAFVKASSFALQELPAVNAVIDGTDIVYRDYVDISVAVATPNGLVVPVLRNCEKMSFADVEKSIANLSEKARTGNLTIEDMQGGTFSISNGGVFGSLFGTPIINPPQSAILGMHAIVNRPIAVGNNVEIRPMMYVALTYDHRLIDGREAVTFLKKIKELIEDPRKMLVSV